MSSDTLRGIGQEGDDESEGVGAGLDAADGRSPKGETKGDTKGESTGDQPQVSKKIEDRKVRSLDAVVPETRSLDTNVPEEPESLDAKVSTFAATLPGVQAPVVDRDRGTVLGRDVHLPVEVHRSAGLRPVANDDDRSEIAAPVAIEHSEPTQADSVVGAAVARSTARDEGPVDRDSHGPWYDQIPPADEVYDDPGPNMLARVAIGAALAAMLSIFIFGFVRLRGRNAPPDDAPVSQIAPARTAPPLQAPGEAPIPTGAMPGGLRPLLAAPTIPVSPTPGAAAADIPAPTVAPPYGEVPDLSAEPLPPKHRSPTTRVPAVGTAGRPAAASRTDAFDSSDRARTTSAGTSPESAAAALAVRPPIPESPTQPPNAKSTSPDKPKTKPVYDPDSTLPLNIE